MRLRSVLPLSVALCTPLTFAQPHPAVRESPAATAAPPAPASRTPASAGQTPRIPLVWLLDARVPEIRLEEMPLRQVFDELAKSTRATVYVNWQALNAVGVREDRPITVHARNMRFGHVLWMILREAAGTDAKLAYRISNDMLYVSTFEELSEEMLVRVYPVEDLLVSELRFPRLDVVREHDYVAGLIPTVNNGAVAVRPIVDRVASGTRLVGENSGGDIDEGLNGNRGNSGTHGDDARAQRLQELINVITTTVEPESWDINGGRGTIRGFRDKLVVRNSAFVHEQLAGPLFDSR